eukprot:TRINITY_DN110445_c0_g1_i1.p1 TRINITY_DN110445_c0_g1~~TRINITY_DN110445_c0_g1_i1.p1  ORF type:complete len:214 (+),score=42.72 TRINITY_DN110445_c0_g1_i1:78-719(+)
MSSSAYDSDLDDYDVRRAVLPCHDSVCEAQDEQRQKQIEILRKRIHSGGEPDVLRHYERVLEQLSADLSLRELSFSSSMSSTCCSEEEDVSSFETCDIPLERLERDRSGHLMARYQFQVAWQQKQAQPEVTKSGLEWLSRLPEMLDSSSATGSARLIPDANQLAWLKNEQVRMDDSRCLPLRNGATCISGFRCAFKLINEEMTINYPSMCVVV